MMVIVEMKSRKSRLVGHNSPLVFLMGGGEDEIRCCQREECSDYRS